MAAESSVLLYLNRVPASRRHTDSILDMSLQGIGHTSTSKCTDTFISFVNHGLATEHHVAGEFHIYLVTLWTHKIGFCSTITQQLSIAIRSHSHTPRLSYCLRELRLDRKLRTKAHFGQILMPHIPKCATQKYYQSYKFMHTCAIQPNRLYQSRWRLRSTAHWPPQRTRQHCHPKRIYPLADTGAVSTRP